MTTKEQTRLTAFEEKEVKVKIEAYIAEAIAKQKQSYLKQIKDLSS